MKDHVNLSTEESLLYLLCSYPNKNDLIYKAIHPDMFYFKPYQKLYSIFRDLNDKQDVIDLTTLYIEIDKNYFADKENIKKTIDSMLNANIYSCNTPVLVGNLIENYRKRMFLKLSVDMQEELTGKTTEEIKDKINYEIDRIMKHYEIQDEKPADTFRSILHGLNPGIKTDIVKTGIRPLDEMIYCLKKGSLITIGAATSIGKTSLALNIVWNVFNDFRKVIVFALEVNKEDNYNRIISNISDIPYEKFFNKMLGQKDFNLILQSMSRLKSDNLRIYDTDIYTIKKIRQQAEKYVAKNGSIDLLVVDHIQLLSDKKSKNILEVVTEITKQLKILAKDLNCAVIALSQLTRSADPANPKVSDLRSSGTIEQDSDVVMFLTRNKSFAKITICKNRDGLTGTFDLKWDGQFQRFSETKNQD